MSGNRGCSRAPALPGGGSISSAAISRPSETADLKKSVAARARHPSRPRSSRRRTILSPSRTTREAGSRNDPGSGDITSRSGFGGQGCVLCCVHFALNGIGLVTPATPVLHAHGLVCNTDPGQTADQCLKQQTPRACIQISEDHSLAPPESSGNKVPTPLSSNSTVKQTSGGFAEALQLLSLGKSLPSPPAIEHPGQLDQEYYDRHGDQDHQCERELTNQPQELHGDGIGVLDG